LIKITPIALRMGKRSDGKAIVEIAAIPLAPKVLKFEM
jgi:hypothetical protein